MNVCRTSLRRALAPSPLRAVFSASSPAVSSAPFSTSPASRNAAPTPAAASAAASAPAAAAEAPKALSSCVEGTVLVGLNYTKGRSDPVAMRDEDYPSWLWDCLDVMKKADADADADAGDEFSKSKKQRRMARRRQRDLEAEMLATGDVTALAPKIPLQHQTLNLAGGGEVTTDVNATLEAAAKRTELRVAMRKERRAKIKEDNYLRSM